MMTQNAVRIIGFNLCGKLYTRDVCGVYGGEEGRLDGITQNHGIAF